MDRPATEQGAARAFGAWEGCSTEARRKLEGFYGLAHRYATAGAVAMRRLAALPPSERKQRWHGGTNAAPASASPSHWFGPYSEANLRLVVDVYAEVLRRFEQGFAVGDQRSPTRVRCVSATGTRCERRRLLLANASEYGTIRVCPRLLAKGFKAGAMTIFHELIHQKLGVGDRRDAVCSVGDETRCYRDGARALVAAGKYDKALRNNDNYVAFARAVHDLSSGGTRAREEEAGMNRDVQHDARQRRPGRSAGLGACGCAGCTKRASRGRGHAAYDADDSDAEFDGVMDGDDAEFDSDGFDAGEDLDTDTDLDARSRPQRGSGAKTAMGCGCGGKCDCAKCKRRSSGARSDMAEAGDDAEAWDDPLEDALDADAEDGEDGEDGAWDDDDDADSDDDDADLNDDDDDAVRFSPSGDLVDIDDDGDSDDDDDENDATTLGDLEAGNFDDESLGFGDNDDDGRFDSTQRITTKNLFIKRIKVRDYGLANTELPENWKPQLEAAVNEAEGWLRAAITAIDGIWIGRTRRAIKRVFKNHPAFSFWFGTGVVTIRQIRILRRRMHKMGRFFHQKRLRFTINQRQDGTNSHACKSKNGTFNIALTIAPVIYLCPAFWTRVSAMSQVRTIIHELTHRLLQPLALVTVPTGIFTHPWVNGRGVKFDSDVVLARTLARKRSMASRRSPQNWAFCFQEIGTRSRPTETTLRAETPRRFP